MDSDPSRWKRWRHCFDRDLGRDARAKYVMDLTEMKRRPHKDENPVIAGYWQYLNAEKKAPTEVWDAVSIQEDPAIRQILQAAIVAELPVPDIAAMTGHSAGAVEAFRDLFFAPDQSPALWVTVAGRFRMYRDTNYILPMLAVSGGWPLVEMALGIRRWTKEGRRTMDGMIARQEAWLEYWLADRFARVNWPKRGHGKILTWAMRCQGMMPAKSVLGDK